MLKFRLMFNLTFDSNYQLPIHGLAKFVQKLKFTFKSELNLSKELILCECFSKICRKCECKVHIRAKFIQKVNFSSISELNLYK